MKENTCLPIDLEKAIRRSQKRHRWSYLFLLVSILSLIDFYFLEPESISNLMTFFLSLGVAGYIRLEFEILKLLGSCLGEGEDERTVAGRGTVRNDS